MKRPVQRARRVLGSKHADHVVGPRLRHVDERAEGPVGQRWGGRPDGRQVHALLSEKVEELVGVEVGVEQCGAAGAVFIEQRHEQMLISRPVPALRQSERTGERFDRMQRRRGGRCA